MVIINQGEHSFFDGNKPYGNDGQSVPSTRSPSSSDDDGSDDASESMSDSSQDSLGSSALSDGSSNLDHSSLHDDEEAVEDDDDHEEDQMSDDGQEEASCSGSYSESMETSAYTDSEDWSSEDYDEYEELMAEMPIALDRTGSARRVVPTCTTTPLQSAEPTPEGVMNEGLPISLSFNSKQSSQEGLTMLQNLRADLEKVGRMIVAKKEGEKFVQRAHILASINWLSSNLPSCVLDHLGQEIRGVLKSKEESKSLSFARNEKKSLEGMETFSVVSDEMSVSSDLSGGEDDDRDFAGMLEQLKHDLNPSATDENQASLSQLSVTWSPQKSSTKSVANTISCSRNVTPLPHAPHLSSPTRKKSNSPRKAIVTPNKVGRRPIGRHDSLLSFVSLEQEEDPLPALVYFRCALLFVDISGFTELATLIDPEHLSRVINSYFDSIVEKVFEFGGDIQKFAGDALFAEWRATDIMSLELCAQAAAACASSLVKECADFPVLAVGGIFDLIHSDSPTTALLNVHCGLGVGEMAGIHVGDNMNRREYIYLGDPIFQATKACEDARLGEVVASPRFNEFLQGNANPTSTMNTSIMQRRGSVIASRDSSQVCVEYKYDPAIRKRNAKSRGVTDYVDGLHVDSLAEYRRLMSLYVHPVVVMNDVAASGEFRSTRVVVTTERDRHRAEAELRSVFVMFINPLISVNLTGDPDNDARAATLLNDIMNLATRELKHYSGHLRQFIVDDKGLVLIATFGLRGSSFPNMVAERALPATTTLYSALQAELGVDCRIGATFGDVYCGAVGGVKRSEYSVMGPPVNLAARLMSSPDNPGILVDNAVRKLAARSYCFNALDPVTAKGYRDPVPIFEPLSPLDRAWGRIEPNFAGRQKEIMHLLHLAKDILCDDSPAAKVVMISGSSGTGKSALLAHSIEHIKRMVGQRNLVVAKHVCRDSDSLVPFSSLRPLFLKVLTVFGLQSDDKSFVSLGSSDHSSHVSIAYNSLSGRSTTSASVLSETIASEVLSTIFAEFSVPAQFALYGMHYIIGTNLPKDSSFTLVPSLNAMASFLARAFIRCTEDARLVVCAIDDVNRTDEMSWKVLREIFERSNNVMLIGTSSSATAECQRIEQDFREELHDNYRGLGRFVEIEIGRLSKDDIILMTMKTLGLRKHDVTPELLNEVLVESGGLPSFANKILEGIKHRSSNSPALPFYHDSDDARDEIILHRVDSLDLTTRGVLNVGSVLGTTFLVSDVIDVFQSMHDGKSSDIRRETIESLRDAVKEGILITVETSNVTVGTDVDIDFQDETQIRFRDDVWRTILLRLMLDSRKRDIHRKMAVAIEARVSHLNDNDIDLMRKLHYHWKGSGDSMKTVHTALTLGNKLECMSENYLESVNLYEQVLRFWGWNKEHELQAGGFTTAILDVVCAPDLANIIMLMVALGRVKYFMGNYNEGVATFDKALNVYHKAKASKNLRDRSIIFPAFTGIFRAIAEGHVQQDVYCRYESSLLRSFMEETRIHGRLIHHIHALFLQLELYSRLGEIDKATAVHSIIKKLYKPEKHSIGLINVYGRDTGALSYSYAAFGYSLQGDSKKAMKICRTIIKEIIPHVGCTLDQSFAIMYPIIFVMKESGYARQASGFFEKVLIAPFSGTDSFTAFPFLCVYEPMLMLLHLSSTDDLAEEQMKDYLLWALKPENLRFDEDLNLRLGRLGRCADCIAAEICVLLATRLPLGFHRNQLISFGLAVASHAAAFNRKHGLKTAVKEAYTIIQTLRLVGAQQPGKQEW